MANLHRRRSQPCANTKMPEGLTEELRQRLLQLRSFPKGDYLKSEAFSKFVSSETDPASVRRQRAINKWLATEAENEATNDRLLITPREHIVVPGVTFGEIVDYCQSLVERIIGATAPVEALLGTFSGGASTSRSRTESHPASKFLGQADVTARCLELFETLVPEMPGWLADGGVLDYQVVPGNVMFTVPKKTDIDRCACKEPDLNMFIQKGIGSHFRDCLLRIGINLNDQSINRSLARSGSLTGDLATLDLSSASDSVSIELVSLLLPECWYTLLDSARSHVTVIDGEEHRNHMWSSMGNGFTFELESLLFYVLTRAACAFTKTRGRVSVYGDDIICPTAAVPTVIAILEWFGFQVNLDKSHYTGEFRESCGGHYLSGRDITPFYVKAPVETLVDVIDVANKLRRWALIEDYSILDPEVYDIWVWLRDLVPTHLWGGEDTSFKYRLVSPHIGRSRLVEKTKRVPNGDGGYFHWLNATWRRDKAVLPFRGDTATFKQWYDTVGYRSSLPDGVSTSSRSKNLSRFEVKPVRNQTVARLPGLFYQELS